MQFANGFPAVGVVVVPGALEVAVPLPLDEECEADEDDEECEADEDEDGAAEPGLHKSIRMDTDGNKLAD